MLGCRIHASGHDTSADQVFAWSGEAERAAAAPRHV